MRNAVFVLAVVVGLAILLVALMFLNLAMASRRQRRRVHRLLLPVLQPIADGHAPDPVAIRNLAARPLTRNALLQELRRVGKADLFPAEFTTRQAAAESDLAFWLAHPNELQQPPDEIQLVQAVTMPSELGELEYYLFKFRTREPHWAAKKGWMAGVSGPYPKRDVSLAIPGGTFSELEPIDAKPAEQFVREFHQQAMGRGVARSLSGGQKPEPHAA